MVVCRNEVVKCPCRQCLLALDALVAQLSGCAKVLEELRFLYILTGGGGVGLTPGVWVSAGIECTSVLRAVGAEGYGLVVLACPTLKLPEPAGQLCTSYTPTRSDKLAFLCAQDTNVDGLVGVSDRNAPGGNELRSVC